MFLSFYFHLFFNFFLIDSFFYCIFLQETYELQDIYYYNDCTVDKHDWASSGTITSTYSSNGLNLNGGSDGAYVLDKTLPSSFELEYEIVNIINGIYSSMFDVKTVRLFSSTSPRNRISYGSYYGGSWHNWTDINGSYLTNGDVIKAVISNNQVAYYRNGNLIGTLSQNSEFTGIKFIPNNNQITIKNFKIRQL